MNKTAIAFSTKDRVELTRQSVEPLLLPGKFDLFWMDGSDTPSGEDLPMEMFRDRQPAIKRFELNVRGGADAAIVYGLTTLLDHPNNYEFVGLVENDVLLDPNWFAPTMALFDRGEADGLDVGAVSARCFDDRILCQRDGYALCHNLGAGMVIFRRDAARIVLNNFRTGYWPDNRAIFAQLSGIDIGRYAAFRDREQHVTADWHFDAVLARHGLASLALTPSPVQMIGQDPPLAEQGLRLVTEPVELLRNDEAFEMFADRTQAIRDEAWELGGLANERLQFSDGVYTIFPHQFGKLGGKWEGDWQLKWSQGFGPFSWKSGLYGSIDIRNEGDVSIVGPPTLTLPLIGAVDLLVGGGEHGGYVEVVDTATGYKLSPQLLPDTGGQVMSLQVPAVMQLRGIRLTALSEGVVVYGVRTRTPQPTHANRSFDHSYLPPV